MSEQDNSTVESKQIRLREDLEITQYEDGTMQIRDPQAVRFFQLGFSESEVIRLLAHLPPAQILRRASYTKEELKKFFGMLKQWGLLEGTTPPGIQMAKSKTLLQFMFQRFKLIDPDKLLNYLEPRLRWLWSRPMQIIGVLIALITVITFTQNAMKFLSYGWPLILDSWTISLFCFICLMFIILSGHEMGHGIALKAFGGNVPEMGFYFVYATPSLYTDVSDIYRLNSKKSLFPIFTIL